jgi:hypothetical protein
MTAIVCHHVDKSKWPRGVWDNEADEMKYYDLDTGLPCIIKRAPNGALMGFVGVDSSMPTFSVHYTRFHSLIVHGGLTYSGMDGNDCPVYHFDPVRRWWIGFDCNRYTDWGPADPQFPNQEYRPWQYVEAEVRKLAAGLKNWRA